MAGNNRWTAQEEELIKISVERILDDKFGITQMMVALVDSLVLSNRSEAAIRRKLFYELKRTRKERLGQVFMHYGGHG